MPLTAAALQPTLSQVDSQATHVHLIFFGIYGLSNLNISWRSAEAVEALVDLMRKLGLSEAEAIQEATFALKFLTALDGARSDQENAETTESDPAA